MVCEFGMSEKLGPITYGNKQEEVFLGKELHEHKNYSETTQILIDDEIKKIVQAGMDKATKVLTDNIIILHRLSMILLEREILDSEEIDKVMRDEELPPVEKEQDNGHNVSETQPAQESNVKPESTVPQN